MCLLPPTKNKRNRNQPFDIFAYKEGIWRGFGLAPKSQCWNSNVSLFASLARSFFGLSPSPKIPTELCEHSHAEWHRPEGQNATDRFRLRRKKRLV